MIGRPRIRQLSLGELLDETFRLYRTDFITLLAIAALVLVPYSILNFFLQLPFQEQLAQLQDPQWVQRNITAGRNPADFFSVLLLSQVPALVVGVVYGLFVQPILQGALAHNVTQQYLGQPAGVRESSLIALKCGLSLIGGRLPVYVLTLLLTSIPTALILAGSLSLMTPLTGAAAAQNPPLQGALLQGFLLMIAGGITYLALGIPLIFVLVRLLFTSQAVVVERLRAGGAIRRSWRLTRGSFWRTLGYLAIVWLIATVIAGVPTYVVTWLAGMLLDDRRLVLVITTSMSAVTSVLVTPFSLIAYTLMYYDVRIRKEAFDLEQHSSTLLRASLTH